MMRAEMTDKKKSWSQGKGHLNVLHQAFWSVSTHPLHFWCSLLQEMLYPPSGSFPDAWVPGTSLVVQGLRLYASSARGVGLIPYQGTKIPHSTGCAQNSLKMKKKKIFWVPLTFPRINLTVHFHLGLYWIRDRRKYVSASFFPILSSLKSGEFWKAENSELWHSKFCSTHDRD